MSCKFVVSILRLQYIYFNHCNLIKLNRIMGCSQSQSVMIPNIPANHLNRLLQVSEITHPLNVNKKYEHLSKIRDGEWVGSGFKRCLGYDSLTTLQQLHSKRKQFWETRVNGSPDCWNAIRLAVEEPDQQTGLTILKSMNISMLHNNIQMCVDTRFNKYQVPVFCLSDPLSISQETMAEKNLNYTYNDDTMQVRIRSVKYPTEDIKLTMSSATQLVALKNMLRETKQIPASQGIRFFYNGRQMIDGKTLGNYNYLTGTVIQAMIR